MKKVGRIGLIAILLLTTTIAHSQKLFKKKVDNRYGYHFVGKNQKFAKIPFEFHANLIVIKTIINTSDTLRFILDTGVSSTIITDPNIAKQLQLTPVRRVKISGAGEEEELMADVSVGHSIRMGDVVANHQNLVIIEKDILKLSEFLGIPIHGIFGHDLFNSFVIKIDFENKELMLTLPDKFKYKKSMGERYPMIVTQSKPYTDAVALVSNNKSIPMRLVIDTGAGHALLLRTDDHKEINLPNQVIRANLGRGLNGEINGHIGRVNKIKLGSLEMQDIIASFPDSISFSMKFPPSVENRQGSIGCELLRRFHVTLNYHDGYICLRPIRTRMRESFEHDMSGMEVRAKGEKFNQYVVDKIIEGSPADLAGLQSGDEILFINNLNTTELTISEIYKMLSKKEGKMIDLLVRRKGQLEFTSFKLRRMI
ncbi:MAG: aspartyl protease family protein [Spirosomataceae bacterium]